MNWMYCFGGVWLIVLVRELESNVISGDLPCPSSETINITNGTLNSDDSITFDGMRFPPDQYSPKVSQSKPNERVINVPTYGCVCNIKKCIRFCRRKDVPAQVQGKDFKIKVLTGQGNKNQTQEIDLHKSFNIVTGMSCLRTVLSIQMTQVSKISIFFNRHSNENVANIRIKNFYSGW